MAITEHLAMFTAAVLVALGAVLVLRGLPARDVPSRAEEGSRRQTTHLLEPVEAIVRSGGSDS